VVGRSRAQLPKVVEGAESGMDRRVPALAATDRVRAADVVCLGAQAVVLAFAIGVSDRMDRRFRRSAN
jgi:hypothetical protein